MYETDFKSEYYRQGMYDKECAAWRVKHGEKNFVNELTKPKWMRPVKGRKKNE